MDHAQADRETRAHASPARPDRQPHPRRAHRPRPEDRGQVRLRRGRRIRIQQLLLGQRTRTEPGVRHRRHQRQGRRQVRRLELPRRRHAGRTRSRCHPGNDALSSQEFAHHAVTRSPLAEGEHNDLVSIRGRIGRDKRARVEAFSLVSWGLKPATNPRRALDQKTRARRFIAGLFPCVKISQ